MQGRPRTGADSSPNPTHRSKLRAHTLRCTSATQQKFCMTLKTPAGGESFCFFTNDRPSTTSTLVIKNPAFSSFRKVSKESYCVFCRQGRAPLLIHMSVVRSYNVTD
jgi:hypothetical protein